MCGIGGILTHPGKAKIRADATRLSDSLAHRGRSGRGAYTDDTASLYSARHAVIALSEAAQPLHDSGDEYVMVGNGEVLNYGALTAELPPERRAALKPGDLQVALELFATHGPAAFESLRGPFALAVWDKTRARLTLVRDRLGERPLYFYDDGTCFVFASEVRCLKAALGNGLTHDDVSLLSFIGLGRLLGDRTIYREIKAMRPGAVLQIDMRSRVRAWSELAPISELRGKDADPAGDDEVLALLTQATSRAFVADCPMAIGFSGGVDSSVILKAALEKADVTAIVTVFSALTPDEDENLHRSRAVAKLFGVDILEVPFTLPDFDTTVGMLHTTLDQPCAEPLVMHNDALHTAAAEHARVLVGGHGADEVFAGYEHYSVPPANGGRSTTGEWLAAAAVERWNRAASWPRMIGEFVCAEFAAAVDLPMDALDRPLPYGFAEHSDPILFGQALDLFRLMCYHNFRITDENGITRGVEVRSPFFDIDLISGAFSQPWAKRIVPGNSKHLLKRLFEGTPQANAFAAAKVGFDDYFPYPDWIAANWPHFSDLIAQGPLVELGVLRDGILHQSENLDWRSKWRLFSLSAWLTRR